MKARAVSMKRCLVCGEEIPKGATIEDAILVGGIDEEGTHWHGYAFVCKFKCFMELKKRMFKDKQGKETIFIVNEDE